LVYERRGISMAHDIVKSNYRARSIKTQDGKSITDVVITDNDWDIFKSFLPQVAALVFEPISVLAQNVEDGFVIDLIGGSENSPQVSYQINYNNGVQVVDTEGNLVYTTAGYDMNQLNVLDTYVFDALVTGCLVRWYEEIGLMEEAAYQQRNFDDLIRNIRTSILYRKSDGRTKIPHRTL
jgi:hypothetical protein